MIFLNFIFQIPETGYTILQTSLFQTCMESKATMAPFTNLVLILHHSISHNALLPSSLRRVTLLDFFEAPFLAGELVRDDTFFHEHFATHHIQLHVVCNIIFYLKKEVFLSSLFILKQT